MTDACGFAKGGAKEDIVENERTQQAIVLGGSLMKTTNGHTNFALAVGQVPWRNRNGARNRISPTANSEAKPDAA